MARYLIGRETSPYRIGALLLVLFALLWSSPAEQTLGSLIKVVYVHGALVRVAEFVFLASGLLGLLYLIKKLDWAIQWSWALQKTAFFSWLFSFLISLYIMRMAWGGINWAEPRFLATGRVLAIALIAIAACLLLENLKVVAVAGIVMGIIVSIEIATAGLQLHPANPIGDSPSMLTKTDYYGIVAVCFLLALELTRLFVPVKPEPDIATT